MPENLIIADASPIISLYSVGELTILKELYQQVTITQIVREEIQVDLPDWIIVQEDYDRVQFQLLCLELDPGEASAIALAVQHDAPTLIIDERKGRNVAKRLQLKVTGTLGIIIKAKEEGIIDSGKKVLDKLEEHGFWLSMSIKHEMLVRLKEI